MNKLPENRPATVWLTYVKALSFLLPSIGVFAVASVFIAPKIKQMCADVGYDPQGLFGPMDLALNYTWLLLISVLALIVLMETFLPIWRRHRAAFIAVIVFLVNSAVLVQLVCALFVAVIVGPAMHRLH
jgi:hypothetical protein